MFPYSMIFAKLGLGLLALILQINLLGKRNLAPTSALDQIQNYVSRIIRVLVDGKPVILIEQGEL